MFVNIDLYGFHVVGIMSLCGGTKRCDNINNIQMQKGMIRKNEAKSRSVRCVGLSSPSQQEAKGKSVQHQWAKCRRTE